MLAALTNLETRASNMSDADSMRTGYWQHSMVYSITPLLHTAHTQAKPLAPFQLLYWGMSAQKNKTYEKTTQTAYT